MSFEESLPVGAPRAGQPRPSGTGATHGAPEDDAQDTVDQPAMQALPLPIPPDEDSGADDDDVEDDTDDDPLDLLPPDQLFRPSRRERRRQRRGQSDIGPLDDERFDFDRLPPTPLEKAGDAVWLVSHKVGYSFTKNVRVDLRHQMVEVDQVLAASRGKKRKVAVANRGGGSAKTPVISVMAVADAVSTNDKIMDADCNQNSGHLADLLGVKVQDPEESTAGKTRLELGTSPFHMLYEEMSDKRNPEQFVSYDWLSRMLCNTPDGVAVVASDTAKNRTFTNVGCIAVYEQFSVNYDRVYRDTGNDTSRATSLMAIHDCHQLVMPCIADIRKYKTMRDLVKTQRYLRGRGYASLVDEALIVVIGGKEKDRAMYARMFGKQDHPEHIFFIDKCRHLARYEPIKWNRLPYKVQLQVKQLVAAAIGKPLPMDLVDYVPPAPPSTPSKEEATVPEEEPTEGDVPAAPADGTNTQGTTAQPTAPVVR